jgi:hypothetical protein
MIYYKYDFWITCIAYKYVDSFMYQVKHNVMFCDPHFPHKTQLFDVKGVIFSLWYSSRQFTIEIKILYHRVETTWYRLHMQAKPGRPT